MGNAKNTQQNIQWSLEAALQGLAFWISYRQVLCYEHPINEGALVAELVTLLRAKLDSEFIILNERKFNKNSRERMDIEIVKKDSEERIAIIEVKRFFAGKTLINKDIEKLTDAKKQKKNEEVLCYLAVISENEIPKTFVENGRAVRKNLSLEKNFTANIRVLKSMRSFKGKNGNIPNANYCCLLKISHINQGEKQ